jgi:hypothetical protein|nr:MAG TPA: hypothetical protein [Caudoviricetes sp.]
MTKEQFIKLMTVIKKKYREIERFWDGFYDLFGSCSDKLVEITSLGEIIGVIADIVDDKEEWIYWYVYENDWVENGLEYVNKNGGAFTLGSLEDLWDLIKNED